MNDFVIDSRLASENSLICELKLCRVLFSGNALFPWIILVPRQNNLREIIDLSEENRIVLMQEISIISRVMQDIFKPGKLNVAKIGNIVPQLHIHIVARYSNDAAWPEPVFGKGRADYEEPAREELIIKLRSAISGN